MIWRRKQDFLFIYFLINRKLGRFKNDTFGNIFLVNTFRCSSKALSSNAVISKNGMMRLRWFLQREVTITEPKNVTYKHST